MLQYLKLLYTVQIYKFGLIRILVVFQAAMVMKLLWRNRPRVGQLAVLLAVLFLAFLVLVTLLFRRLSSPYASSYSAYACPSNVLAGRARSAEELTQYFTPRRQPVTNVVSRFLLQPRRDMCRSSLDLLVIVPSPPGASELRDTIRTTWGSVVNRAWPHTSPGRQRSKVALMFVLGRQGKGLMSTVLMRESKLHGDLLLGDFVDSYQNLTLKMLAGLNWVSSHCSSKVRYVLKADLDVFVHVDLLLDTLQQLQPQPLSHTMLGELLCTEIVNRDATSRVYVKPSLYPFNVYPPYVRGGSYVLTGDLASLLINASRSMPILPVEDAYINGVLAHTLHVQHVHLPRVMSPLGCPMTPCVFVGKRQVTATNVGPDMMRAIWQAVKAGGEVHCSLHNAWWERACLLVSQLWS